MLNTYRINVVQKKLNSRDISPDISTTDSSHGDIMKRTGHRSYTTFGNNRRANASNAEAVKRALVPFSGSFVTGNYHKGPEFIKTDGGCVEIGHFIDRQRKLYLS